MTKHLDPAFPAFRMDRFKFFRRKPEEVVIAPIVVRKRRSLPFCFILGAQDPEMDEIERMLVENGEAFQHATFHGTRVQPWNAYIADPVSVPQDCTLVLVECEPVMFDFEGYDTLLRMADHHRPRDFGYDLPPENFWEASSIGQVFMLLNSVRSASGQLVPTRTQKVLAALDHCAGQARLGKCPGISPEEVKALSIACTARSNKLSIQTVEATVESMRARILSCHKQVLIGAQNVIDMTHVLSGIGYSAEFLCTQEAMISLGKVGLLRTKNKEDGSDKIVICGVATPETIRYFMKSWAPSHGLVYIYGVPARGYAGAYRE